MTELCDYMMTNGGLRLRTNAPVREMAIKLIVSNWPFGCREDEMCVVLMDRLSKAIRKQYGGILLIHCLYVVLAEAVQVSMDWVQESDRNRSLMAKYHAQAS